ncbi:hypothetical protein RYX36_036049, partial [Vicia faba]
MVRIKDCFAADQYWAIYDDTDSMPRFYARIKKVHSPFKLEYTWLEPNPDLKDEIEWHEADLPIACECRISSRENNSNSNDDTNARASISRMVMLAEALFEVLDEIHQRSMILSSHLSVSSIGSIPVPAEVAESLSVKIYT